MDLWGRVATQHTGLHSLLFCTKGNNTERPRALSTAPSQAEEALQARGQHPEPFPSNGQLLPCGTSARDRPSKALEKVPPNITWKKS